MIDTIVIQPGYDGREALKAFEAAPKLGLAIRTVKRCDRERSAPIGDVPFCESWLIRKPRPDFYPHWLDEWTRRAIIRLEASGTVLDNPRNFVKSATGYKDFPAQIVESGTPYPKGSLYVSEVVEFVQEWRYYVSYGKVLATGWYDGNDEDEPAPELNIRWPNFWSGAADFGRLSTGEIALVECQHPYACGHYSDDHTAYLDWIVRGWEYMVRQCGLKMDREANVA